MRVVFGGSCGNSQDIGKTIAQKLSIPFYEIETKVFPDGETFVRLPVEELDNSKPPRARGAELEGMDVIYVQSTQSTTKSTTKPTTKPQSQHLIELFLTVENIKRRKAKKIILIVPYLAHARQDKEFKRGEAISNQVIGKIMKHLGVDYLFTIDVHFNREVGKYLYEGINAYNVTATGTLARYIRDELGIISPKIIIPDHGHKPIVEFITPILGDDITFGKKVRNSESEVIITFPEKEDFKGKVTVIFDDMISSGTTCIKTAEYLKRRGASKVILAVTHTLYINSARDRLLCSGVDKIVATDTILKEDSVISIAPLLANAIEKWCL